MNITQRLTNVRNVLVDNGLDALLVTNPTNRRYLSGFTAEDHAADESSGVMLITNATATLLVSPTELPWAQSEVACDYVDAESWQGAIVDSVVSLLPGDDTLRLAVEDATTPAAMWFALQEALPEQVELLRAGDTIDRLREVKSGGEIDLLRQAAKLTDEAFARASRRFAVGVTEAQAAGFVRAALRELGSDGEAFDTIVAAGPNAAKPHHRPGPHALVEGEPIIVDMGAVVDGYNGDLTRTVCLGTPDDQLVRIYETVLAAQRAGLDAIRADVPASDPDLATREVFASHDLEAFVIHSAGHGLGLRVHESPPVRRTSDARLEIGNVITMEPGLYIPDWGGVRIEDVAVVRDNGHENLTSSPKGLEALAI